MFFKGNFPQECMRKIRSKEETERAKKRNLAAVGILMLALLLLSTLGFAFLSGGGGGDRNGQSSFEEELQNIGDSWVLRRGSQVFSFKNHYNDIQDVNVEINSNLGDYVSKPLYIDSGSDPILNAIASNLGQYAERVSAACYGECEENLPEKNCTENLIVWTDSTINRVRQEENCIFIEGDMRAVDAFLYRILGIA